MSSKTISARRLATIAAIAVVISTIVNISISFIARIWYTPSPDFTPLGIGPIIFWSIICGLGATLVYAWVDRYMRQPLIAYVIIAAIVYICTFIPDSLLLSGALASVFKDANFDEVVTLMSMHAAEAIILVITFIVIGFRKRA